MPLPGDVPGSGYFRPGKSHPVREVRGLQGIRRGRSGQSNFQVSPEICIPDKNEPGKVVSTLQNLRARSQSTWVLLEIPNTSQSRDSPVPSCKKTRSQSEPDCSEFRVPVYIMTFKYTVYYIVFSFHIL